MEEKKRVPCEMTTYSNDLRRVIREKPCVTCDFRCGTCGWNPAEQRRRLRTGVRRKPLRPCGPAPLRQGSL